MYYNKSIVIYLNGETQYEAGNLFMHMLAQEFERQGLNVIAIDLGQSQNEVITAITQSVSQDPICFLSYNGILSNLNSGGKSLYEIYDIPMLAWLVDHPALHYSRLENGGKRIIAGCIDKNHAEIIPQTTSESLSGFFCPHFACCDENITDKETSFAENKSDNFKVIMPITLGIPASIQASQLKEKSSSETELFHHLTEYSDSDASIDTFMLAKKWLQKKNIAISRHDLASYFVKTVIPIDSYIRAKRREDLLTSFRKTGISIDVYGNAPTGHPALDGHKHHGPINFEQLQKVIRKSTIVLDSGGNYSNGTHERVLTAAGYGKFVITPKNVLWSEVFHDTKDIYLYSPATSHRVAEYVLEMKNNNNFTLNGDTQKVVAEQFSVKNTVEKIMTLDALGLLH